MHIYDKYIEYVNYKIKCFEKYLELNLEGNYNYCIKTALNQIKLILLSVKNILEDSQQENLLIKDCIEKIIKKGDVDKTFFIFELDEDWNNREIPIFNENIISQFNIKLKRIPKPLLYPPK